MAVACMHYSVPAQQLLHLLYICICVLVTILKVLVTHVSLYIHCMVDRQHFMYSCMNTVATASGVCLFYNTLHACAHCCLAT